MEYTAVIRTLGKAGEKYQTLLDSLVSQVIPPKEIIVYIAEGYPIPKETCGKEKYVYVPKGMVAQRALNYDEVQTEYILFLDDDMYLPPSLAEDLFKAMAKKRLYDSYNLRSPEGISYCEDFHLAVRLCYYSDKVVHINKSYYNYRQQPHSIVHNLNKKTESDEQWVYQDTIRFFKEQGVYEDYRKVMSWRVLKSAQELLLDHTGHKRFMELFNDGKEFIFSCPFVNKKIKILAWLITHNLRPAVVLFDRMRSMIGR